MLTRLHERTLELVTNRPRDLTYEVIAEATGLDADWINAFRNGRIKDPGVSKVEKLYTFLSGRELDI